jgi:hypothetical protein
VAVVIAVVTNYILMTKLSARFLAIPLTDIVRPHLPGMWVSLWLAVALSVTLPIFRTVMTSPLFTLLAAGGVCGVSAVCAALSAPRLAKSQIIAQLLQRVPLERFGGVGQVAVRLFT